MATPPPRPTAPPGHCCATWLTSNLARNKDETFSQNYRRLGLVTKLGKATGGTEPRPHELDDASDDEDDLLGRPQPKRLKKSSRTRDSLALPTSETAIAREVRVERDAAGNIVRVLGAGSDNPLGDPLNALESSSGYSSDEDPRTRQNRWEEEWGGISSSDDEADAGTKRKRPAVIRELEREARKPVYKRPRQQSEREHEWLERLVAEHGEDTEAMARDGQLNPMQQTAGDLARRIRKMRKEKA